jgi:hypothetical protein
MYTKEMQIGKKKKKKKHTPSILQAKDNKCYLCILLNHDHSTKKAIHEHHIFFGTKNKDNSERTGLKVYLCPEHHLLGKMSVHRNQEIRRLLERTAQREFEETHTREEFMEIFGENYLDD